MRIRLQLLLHTTCLTAVLCGVAYANPTDGTVTAGSATIASAGPVLNINQSTDKAIIDWRGFDIGSGETTAFHQPGSGSITLNRVNSTSASVINGNLTANGNIVIVNQNGILFGGGANVDVNGLVATTADIDNTRFMSDQTLHFDKPGNPNAAIINQGVITAKEAGLVGLVAPNVINEGIITARLGRVHLASGDTATVDLYGDGLMEVAVSDAVTSQLVHNSGAIVADGGTVALTAAAGSRIVNSLINNTGLLRAQSVGVKNGEIVIAAEGSNAVKNNITANKGVKSGHSTVLNSGTLDASGRGVGERGGNITVTGDNIALLDGTFIDASGDMGLAGTTSGLLKSAHRVGSAGGEILIGGDYLGQGTTATASNLYVDQGALILNDALTSGDAGRSIFWSDETTTFLGNVYARALGGQAMDATSWSATLGGNIGDGGFVETSGHGQLNAGGYVDLTASNGGRGTYFLDPTNITIYGNVDPTFVSTDGSINLAANLKLWIDASDTSKVNLTYNTMSTTATGTSGATTITVGSNTGLAVGARVRLGGAGAVTAASTLGADTYTITAINGTTITLSSALTQNYNTTVYQGYVNQLTDKSGQGNNSTQATAASMPLWISNGQNGLGVTSFNGSNKMFLNSNISLYDLSIVSVGGRSSTSSIYTPVGGPSNYTSVLQYNDGTYYFMNNSNYVTSTAGPNDTNNNIIVWNRAAGVASYQVNGTSYALGALDNDAMILNEIGNRGTNGTPTTGRITEINIYDKALSSDESAILSQYQSTKWGISLTPPGAGATEVAKATASGGFSAFTNALFGKAFAIRRYIAASNQ